MVKKFLSRLDHETMILKLMEIEMSTLRGPKKICCTIFFSSILLNFENCDQITRFLEYSRLMKDFLDIHKMARKKMCSKRFQEVVAIFKGTDHRFSHEQQKRCYIIYNFERKIQLATISALKNFAQFLFKYAYTLHLNKYGRSPDMLNFNIINLRYQLVQFLKLKFSCGSVIKSTRVQYHRT